MILFKQKRNAIFIIALTSLVSCKMVDLRTDYARENRSESDEEKGKRLLKETYLAMGYDKMENVETYEVNSLFDWKMPWTLMPMNALPGNKNNTLHFKFANHTFDGNVTYLEGRRKAKTYGIQSFQTYIKKENKDVETIRGKRENWGLATYHYVIEAPARLLKADIIRYAGEREFEGKTYDLVYATWGEDDPHKEHDQWMIYINQKTKFTDLTEITINDFFLPMPNGAKGGTIRTERTKAKNGTYLPSHVFIQLGKPKPIEKYVYSFSLENYDFDTFPTAELYPISGIQKLGDAKN